MAASAISSTGRGIAHAGLPRRARAAGAAHGVDARAAKAASLLVAMALGCLALWTAVPAGVLWLCSRLSGSSNSLTAGVVLAVALGVPGAMVLGTQALVRVERVYERVTGSARGARPVHGWRRSLSDSPGAGPASALEKMMAASVLVCLVCFVTWFFAFAGSSLPA
jgi:hypothetical protein